MTFMSAPCQPPVSKSAPRTGALTLSLAPHVATELGSKQPQNVVWLCPGPSGPTGEAQGEKVDAAVRTSRFQRGPANDRSRREAAPNQFGYPIRSASSWASAMSDA